MAEELLSNFRTAYEQSSAAFNEGDLDRALSATPEDLEWHAVNEDPEQTVLLRAVRVRQFLSREEALASVGS